MSRYDDDTIESVLITEQYIRRARKERRCDYCGETLQIGKGYWRVVGLVDGEIYVATGCSPRGECAWEPRG